MCYEHGGIIDDGRYFGLARTIFAGSAETNTAAIWVRELAGKLD
jgi:hypothetical protein